MLDLLYYGMAIAASCACTSRLISVPEGLCGRFTTMYRVVGRIAVAVVISSRALRICLLIAAAEKLGT